MGEQIRLKAADGFELGGYRAAPSGRPRAGIVVIQEIFGVNRHIRNLCDGFAADGYLAIAPAVYDRAERDMDLGYTADDIAKGRAARGKLTRDMILADVAGTVKLAAEAGRVGITGYCFGGGVTLAAACRVPGIAAASGYYGGSWGEFVNEAPKCPTMLHFGSRDAGVPLKLVDEFRSRQPQMIVHVHDADHGFSCEERPNVYNAYAHQKARNQTMGLFAATLE
jgi:carboxymethylenebutenolidase